MKPRAFTLVELLVVTAVITLLMAILLPSLGAARDQSKSLVCLSNLKQLIEAAHMYAGSNEEFYPMSLIGRASPGMTISACWDFTTTTVNGQKTVVPGILWQGSSTIRIQQCPAYKGSANWDVDPYTGYNYNASYIGGQATYWEDMSTPKLVVRSARVFDVKSSSATAVFGDGEFEGGANKLMRSPLPGSLDGDFSDRYAGTQGFRHFKKTNVAYADGSAQSVATSATEVPDQPCATDTGFLSADNSAYDLK